MKLLEDLITPNFEADKIIPTEEDFQKIADAYVDYKLNGKNAEFIHLPWNMARQIKDIYKAVRRLIVAAVFKWDDLVNELKYSCLRLGYSTNELKMLIKFAKDYSAKFDSYYDKYCEPVFNGTYAISQPQNSPEQVTKTPANGTTPTPTSIKILAKPGATFCRIVVYDPKYQPAARRHIYLTKKVGGSYKVSIGGSTVTSWYNEPFFESVQQAEAFIKNIINANTKTNVLGFEYSITDKPVSQGTTSIIYDLSNCILVKSDCGPAWIHERSQYCVEALQENLEEDIEKHDILNPVLWNEDNTLKAEVKDKINEIVNVFVEDLKESDVELNVKDIILLGSNANYNYTKDSDVDIHIIADKNSLKCDDKVIEALYSAYRSIFNSKYEINFYDIPVELYVELENSPRVSNGVYSIKQDKWINEPKQVEIPDLDTDRFESQFKMWENKYLELIADYEDGILEDETEVIDYIDEIYKVRKTGLSKEGEYGIPNLIFKEVRNKGYLDNLKELKNKLISKRLSLEESLNWWEM